jgi:hypothetical protein
MSIHGDLTPSCRNSESTELLLQLLQTLVSSQAGASIFIAIEDISPLTEIAPSHESAMNVLSLAWLSAMAVPEQQSLLRTQIDVALQSLASSFRNTDATTFLCFVGDFFRQASANVRLHNIASPDAC